MELLVINWFTYLDLVCFFDAKRLNCLTITTQIKYRVVEF